ncbi:MAG: AzlC family ABC transporter permease [Rhodopseudomonas sp.]|uniref:AzlC family ABC transporter permease n=1 Tax=Rhodopseudomonas sp. TaxID=1078 RepID=UPI00179C90E6|nr:AzlC family ABC transporter permease [Rhodopseudomonas sp.]NVN85174.1 AzlC family ABC transporter permease [Rhodopseudomonas sp.]
MTTHIPKAPAYWSREAIMPGIVAIGPMLPGTLAFAMAFGAQCAQKNFSLVEVEVMMATVYGGLSQFVAVQSWPDRLTPSSIATLALLTLTVNIRFFLMSATLRPWFGTLPAWQAYPAMLLVTDGGWLAAMRYREHGGANAWYYLGGALLLYVVWLFAAIPGFLLAEQLTDPKKYGVDLVMPAFYAAMLVPAWKGPRRAIPWVVSGAVALLVHWLVPGWWFIIAGALSGAITAGLLDEPEPHHGRAA